MSALDEVQAIELAKHAWAVDWVGAACLACLLYDHAITLDQEIATMWPTRLSIPKFLFFLNRYVLESMLVFNSIASSRNHLSIPFCVFFLRWLSCTLLATNAIVDGILIMRVYALYHSNRLAQGIALFFYLGGVCAHVALTIDDYVGQQAQAVNDFNILPGCYAASVPVMIAGYWIVPVVVESVMFILIVSKAFIWWKRQSAPPVLILLARDSAIYFSIIFAFLMANLFLFEYGPPSLDSLLLTPSNTVGCIAGSRMLLNLRGLAAADYQESQFHATMRFLPQRRKRWPRPPPAPPIALGERSTRSGSSTEPFDGSIMTGSGTGTGFFSTVPPLSKVSQGYP